MRKGNKPYYAHYKCDILEFVEFRLHKIFCRAGQSDIITLCMRLALVDALFKETKPFVILDDPFVNLDDTYTERALKLLENIGTDHQVIYLVCNSSRCISGR